MLYEVITTYKITEMRYNEPREGVRIMVVVTEPLSMMTFVKPDSDLPSDKKIEVLKLNDLRKFTTGIYEYSVMTSVFAYVDNVITSYSIHYTKLYDV